MAASTYNPNGLQALLLDQCAYGQFVSRHHGEHPYLNMGCLFSRKILFTDLMEQAVKYSQLAQLFPLLQEVLLCQEDPALKKAWSYLVKHSIR